MSVPVVVPVVPVVREVVMPVVVMVVSHVVALALAPATMSATVAAFGEGHRAEHYDRHGCQNGHALRNQIGILQNHRTPKLSCLFAVGFCPGDMLGLLSQAGSGAGRYTRGERISIGFELNDPQCLNP